MQKYLYAKVSQNYIQGKMKIHKVNIKVIKDKIMK